MQKLNIDLAKIPENKIRKVGKGNYTDLILIPYSKGRDDKGNDGMVAVDVSKQEREAGQKGPIIGNYKELGGNGGGQRQQPARRDERPAAPAQRASEPDYEF